MMRAVVLVTVVVAVSGACGSGRRSQMYPAGSDRDDGYGDLAQKSARLLTSDKPDAPLFAHRAHRRHGDSYGGDPYGGAMYGGDPAPPVARASAARAGRYNVITGLSGAIEGTVTWRGAPPAALTTACGAIASPSVRVSAGRAVAGILVYIEHVDVGRPLPSYGRAVTVGGTIAKRGCALAPLAQIVTPLPAGLAIHGDATDARLRVTSPAGAQPFELQAAGRIAVEVQPGVTRVEADDGSLGAAWVVATDTPYYAITDDRGHFRIDELASGTYDVVFWHPPLATLADGKLVYGQPVAVHRTVKVGAGHPARLDLALDR